jgi:hypothetical protein
MSATNPMTENVTPRPRTRRVILLASLLMVAAVVVSLEVFPSYTYSFQASPAISFRASLNATSVARNQTVRITLTDTNYFPFPNEPSVNFLFPNSLNLSSGICGGAYPFGLAAFQGHYTLVNLSVSSSIDIFAPGIYDCPFAFAVPYRLGPFQSVTKAVDLSGYWTAGETPAPGGGFTQGVLHQFEPGNYTLVTEDGWGHSEILYFQVV